MYLCLSKPISFLKNKSNNNNNNYNNNNETVLTKDEFEEAFKSLKRKKAPSHDGLDVNITSVYELIKKPLLKIFSESINCDIFLENMKIAKVIPVMAKILPTNYRPISVILCFLKFWRG